jgi:hypothetical protein
MEFALDDRQKEIRQLLELLGPEPVSYFTDACRIMSDTTGLAAQTHLTAHLLREIDGRLRDVLRPMLPADERTAAKESDDTHKAEIAAAGKLLGLDEPTIEQWAEYAPPLHRFTHRASLAGPRSVAEFRDRFANGQAVLLSVLRRLQAVYTSARPLVKELAAKTEPTEDDLSILTNQVPHSDVVLGEFFSFATLAWFPLLRSAGYFGRPEPLQVDDEGRVSYVEWPAARFLVRAASAENLREDVAAIFGALDTDNPEARDATVEAALKMPPELAARLAPKIATYVRESNAWWTPRHSEELVSHLIDGGEIDAALAVTEPMLAAQPHTADWGMRHALTDLVPKLFPAAGLEGLAMLRGMLADDLDADGREENDYSTIWRESISGGHDMRRRDLLVTALNQSGDALITSGAATARDVATAFAVDHRLIFKRIALHLIAEHPDEELAAEWLADEEVFFDRNVEREYAELAASSFATLEPELKERILAWVEAGPRWRPERLEPGEIDDFHDYWRLRRLRALPDLPSEWQERYDELVERLGDPGDPPQLTRVTTVWSGTRSPVEKNAVLEMANDALLEFVDTWVPEEDWRGPSLEGLANALRDASIDAPERFSRLLPELMSRPPIYAKHVVYGLQQVVTNGGAIDWRPALRFAREAVERSSATGGSDGGDEDQTWAWARSEVCRLVMHGVVRRAIPDELTGDVWQIIAPLADDPDPSVESEDEAEHGGSSIGFQMLNAVRSQAIEAVIQVASWMHDQAGGGGWQLPEDVRSILDRHLDRAYEETRTVAAVYGRHFNHLFELDPGWTTSHFRDFFPDAPERAGHRDAAWRAFVSSTRFWPGSWEVLAPEYERAVGELDVERTAADADSLVDASGSLLGHLLRMFLRDCTDLEDGSLLTRFFDTTALPIRTRFLELVGMDVSNADEISDEVRDQLQRLWEWRTDTVLAGGNTSELAPFAWWFGSAKFDVRWSLEQLIRVLDAGAGVSSEYVVTHRLAALVDDQPGLVVRATALLVERAYTPHMVFGASDELRRILVVGLQSGDEAVTADARATISRLYAERHVEFSEILEA